MCNNEASNSQIRMQLWQNLLKNYRFKYNAKDDEEVEKEGDILRNSQSDYN